MLSLIKSLDADQRRFDPALSERRALTHGTIALISDFHRDKGREGESVCLVVDLLQNDSGTPDIEEIGGLDALVYVVQLMN